MSPISKEEIKQIADEVHKSSPPRKNTPPERETKLDERSTWLSVPMVAMVVTVVLFIAAIGYAANSAQEDAKDAVKKVDAVAKEHEQFRTNDAINNEQHRQILEALGEIKKYIEENKKK